MTDPGPDRIRTPFDALGEIGVQRLVDAFYDIMDSDPAFADLRRLHAGDLGPMRVRLADWLIGWMGGPPVFSERHPGRGCVVSAHNLFRIGQAEADQWMACMRMAMERTGATLQLRTMLDPALAGMCKALVNV
jgi:hemoglobin